MDSFSDVGAPPPAKRVCLSTQTPRTIFSGLITFILAASSAATSAALFVTFDEQHAQWSEQWMARPRFGRTAGDDCPETDDEYRTFNDMYRAEGKAFHDSDVGAAWRRFSLSRLLFEHKLLDEGMPTKNRVAAIAGPSAVRWLFSDNGFLKYAAETLKDRDATALWNWRQRICSARGGWTEASFDTIYGILRVQRTLFATHEECLLNYRFAICAFASAVWLAAALRFDYPLETPSTLYSLAVDTVRMSTAALRGAMRDAATGKPIVVEAVGVAVHHSGRHRSRCFLKLSGADGGKSQMIAFCRQVWGEVLSAPIHSSRAMLCAASDDYLNSAFDCFATLPASGKCGFFQDGVCGIGFEVRSDDDLCKIMATYSTQELGEPV